MPLRAADAAVGRVEPIRSWIETGGMHYVQADVLPIGDEEEEEEEDGGEGSEGDNEDMVSWCFDFVKIKKQKNI